MSSHRPPPHWSVRAAALPWKADNRQQWANADAYDSISHQFRGPAPPPRPEAACPAPRRAPPRPTSTAPPVTRSAAGRAQPWQADKRQRWANGPDPDAISREFVMRDDDGF